MMGGEGGKSKETTGIRALVKSWLMKQKEENEESYRYLSTSIDPFYKGESNRYLQ